MTLSESSSLTREQIRVAVAERLGWTEVAWYEGNNGKSVLFGFSPHDMHSRMVPNYPGSRDACAEMEKKLATDEQIEAYLEALTDVCGGDTPLGKASFTAYFATALQRCRAFLAVTSEVTGNRNE